MAELSDHYADEQTLAAVVSIVRSMATGQSAAASPSQTKVELPGEDTFAKALLEQELDRLNRRIRDLEIRANSRGVLDTQGEANTIFEDGTAVPPKPKRASPTVEPRPPSSIDGEIFSIGPDITAEALEGLKSHIDGQSKLLDEQRVELSSVNQQLLEQKKVQEKALRVLEMDTNVTTLTRELRKHQKANEAFQKALREIGEIVTAVARGDLSKKAKMNSIEMDPEITTFKRTINTMMDQLQVFSSEVSRVAREVGTEGILGGQARIEGVDGTWKELTDNGKFTGVLFSLRRPSTAANKTPP